MADLFYAIGVFGAISLASATEMFNADCGSILNTTAIRALLWSRDFSRSYAANIAYRSLSAGLGNLNISSYISCVPAAHRTGFSRNGFT
jgi:hypothetical protein